MSSPSAFDRPTPDDDADAEVAASVEPEGGSAESHNSVSSFVVPRMLAPHEAAVRAALRTAAAGRDFTWPPLTDAVTSLGRAAQFAQSSLDDLLAIVEMTVRTTLVGPRQKATADAVLVYLLRFARQAYFGARAELLEAQAKRGGPGMR
jgi:hypothetical protein